MAANGISSLAIRSSVAIELWSSKGLKIPYVPDSRFIREESKLCRALSFSADGRFVAWVNGTNVQIATTLNWKVIVTLPRPKTIHVEFSPCGTYTITYELFATSKDNPEGQSNLFIYNTLTGELCFSTIQKKNSVWAPNWSSDESIMALLLGGEAFFYEPKSENGFQKVAKKVGSCRNGSISISPNSPNPFVAFYSPGVKGAPSMCKIFKYPDLTAAQPIGCKSFFQADNVDMLWNKRGSGLLLLTSTDVDQSGASYYGKQALHFMSTKGDSFAVQLSKEGSIHDVKWNPNSQEFCVVYGFMPAKATFFNLKCDPIFECGESDRNCIYYNDFGNIVLLAGFGNLRGNVEVWDVAKKTIISQFKAPDSTLLEWCPNGEMFLTATTAPRLRISNCFKVWHYSGALLHETMWPTGQELYEVVWQKYAPGTHKPNPISYTKIEGIVSSQPQASSVPYRPPNARGIIFPSKVPTTSSIPGGEDKKINDRKKRYKNRREKSTLEDVVAPKTDNYAQDEKKNGTNNSNSKNNVTSNEPLKPKVESTEQSEAAKARRLTKKKIKDIDRKLSYIGELKKRVADGATLVETQQTKIASENELIKKLNNLKASLAD